MDAIGVATEEILALEGVVRVWWRHILTGGKIIRQIVVETTFDTNVHGNGRYDIEALISDCEAILATHPTMACAALIIEPFDKDRRCTNTRSREASSDRR